MSSDEQRIFTFEDFEGARKQKRSVADLLRDNATIRWTPDDSGLFNTASPEKSFHWKEPKVAFLRQNFGGADIVFCRDRPGDLSSGWGGKGAQRCATIDLVVGRMASARSGAGPEEGAVVQNHFGADAARIYISQLTDVDKNFGLARGKHDIAKPDGYLSDARSAVGVKADHVRLVGREGIKIVTGKAPFRGFGTSGETNSRGGRLPPAGKIEFIAGNNTELKSIAGIPGLMPAEEIQFLQPVPKGDNLVGCLTELSDMVESLTGAVMNLSILQTAFNTAVGVDPLRPWVPTAAGAATTSTLTTVISNLWQLRINRMLWNFNYLESYGYKYINSTNVNTT
jgi:hypothetical protein